MKALKIVLIVAAVLIVLLVGGVVLLFVVAGSKSANYWKHTQIGGEIEARYTALGSSEVSYAEYDAKDETIGKYAVWYPNDLKSSGSKYPVVIFANGTGSTSATYKAFLEHLSSWGFIAVGNDDKNTRTGASLEKTIEFLIQENENKDSIFYSNNYW